MQSDAIGGGGVVGVCRRRRAWHWNVPIVHVAGSLLDKRLYHGRYVVR